MLLQQWKNPPHTWVAKFFWWQWTDNLSVVFTMYTLSDSFVKYTGIWAVRLLQWLPCMWIPYTYASLPCFCSFYYYIPTCKKFLTEFFLLYSILVIEFAHNIEVICWLHNHSINNNLEKEGATSNLKQMKLGMPKIGQKPHFNVWCSALLHP